MSLFYPVVALFLLLRHMTLDLKVFLTGTVRKTFMFVYLIRAEDVHFACVQLRCPSSSFFSDTRKPSVSPQRRTPMSWVSHKIKKIFRNSFGIFLNYIFPYRYVIPVLRSTIIKDPSFLDFFTE